jgi:hypothetical protein
MDLAGNHTYDLAVQMTTSENEGEKPALLQLFKNVKNAMAGVVQDLTSINFQVLDYAQALHQFFEKTYFIEKLIIDLETGSKSVAASQKSAPGIKAVEQDKSLLAKLARISQFLQDVIVNMVMADIRYLMQKYLMEMYK